MDFLTLIAYNVIGILAFYFTLGLPAKRYKNRIKVANTLLQDTSVDPTIQNDFANLSKTTASETTRTYWVAVATTVIGMAALFSIYTKLVEPDADIATWVIVSAIYYGVAVIGATVIMSNVVVVAMQVKKLNTMIDQAIIENPQTPIIADAKEIIRVRSGELGVSMLSLTAIIGSVLVGLVYLYIFYTAAQTAIECARSSKCI